jgi:hypothetical protein
MKFEWDHAKAALNLKKLGVSFNEASTVFGDLLAITFDDPEHSSEEERSLTFGLSRAGRLLVVAHTERGEHARIITAREVTRQERGIYE